MNFENKKVVVVGDSILDQTIITSPIGISLESPTLKVEEIDRTITLGGAANVVKNILALGAQCTYVSPVGEDEYIDYYTTWEHKNLSFKKLLSPRHNTVKTRVWIERGTETYKYLQINKTHEDEEVRYRWPVKKIIKGADVVVLVDYGLGMFGEVESIVKAARAYNIPVIASSQMSDKTNRYELFRSADYFCMNEEEAASYHGSFDGCVTLGARGCSFRCMVARESEIVTHRGFVVDTKDPCGAGDSFLAAFSLCIDDINEDSLAFCNAWAAVSTTTVGTITPNLGETYELLRSFKR